MKRTTRNVLAIAGMAGGIFLLGQAVASADEGAGNINESTNTSEATNTNTTTVTTNVAGGDGGTNTASVNTGAIIGGGIGADTAASEASSNGGGGGGGGGEVETGDVEVSQEANGGSVSNSGNASVSGGPTQTATANADTTVHQSASSQGGHSSAPSRGNSSSRNGGGADNINHSDNQSSATNTNTTSVSTNVTGGYGGFNGADVNTGLIVDFGIPILDRITASSSGPAGYYGGFEVDTGDVEVSQEANGGDVSGSGNVRVSGGATQTATADATTDVSQTARSRGHGGGAGNFNHSDNQSSADNYNETWVTTYVAGGDGGANYADVNTGALVFFPFFVLSTTDGAGHDGGGLEVETGDVWLRQEANGGDVRHSGNVSVKGGATQTATADATTDVSQEARSRGHGGGAWNLNWSDNQAYATNSNTTSVTTYVTGGSGGFNGAEVNTGLIVFFPYLSPLSSSSEEYGHGEFEVETGDVSLTQEANGGDVRHSGNVSVKGGATQTATADAATDVSQEARSKGARMHHYER